MWWYIAAFVVALVVGSLLAPKPKNAKPAGIGDFNVPTAEEGREIAVLFGTRSIKGPNVTWYGDLKIKAVKKKGGKK